MNKNNLLKIKYSVLLCFILSSVIKLNAQCAGKSATITICDKELDPTLQNYNLFDQLGPDAETGGTWTANDRQNLIAFDAATGIVDLWEITRNGEHSFTYFNSSCGDSATITIELGGYAGEDNIDGGANACNSDSSVDMFAFLDNEIDGLTTDINGTWTADSNASPYLTDDIFNAAEAGVGTYTFSYEVGAISTCDHDSSTVILEVHRNPVAGTPLDEPFRVCETDDLSLYKNLNLFDYLEEEDINGFWTEDTTNQLDDSIDTFIDIEEIYNNHGAGAYSFLYSVRPNNGVCDDDTASITFYIDKLEGTVSVPSFICDAILSFDINYSESTDYSFSHDMTYEIINTTTNEIVFTDSPTNVNPNEAGITTIALPSSTTIAAPGTYEINITSIRNLNGVICESLTIDSDSFTLFTPEELTTDSVCFNKEDIVKVNISNITDISGALLNETQPLSYNVTYTTDYIDLQKLFNW